VSRQLVARIVLALYAVLLAVIVAIANIYGTRRAFGFVDAVPGGDKLGHFVLLGAFAMLVDQALGMRDVAIARLRVPVGPAIVFAIVFLEELSQLWFRSTRSFDLVDLAADVLGIAVFVALGRVATGRWLARRA
jgi:polysaccharide biosynthesis protein VpsQ